MARQPYAFQMYSLLRDWDDDAKRLMFLQAFTVEIAGSSCSDVVALSRMEKLYLMMKKQPSKSKIEYPDFYTYEDLESSNPAYVVYRTTEPFMEIQRYSYDYDGLIYANKLRDKLRTRAWVGVSRPS